ncbi:MAG: DNA adenine methylase [Chloroflexaceae bacterium]|nr:DNA adenine methylase [Chloroflexaceae bacterium]
MLAHSVSGKPRPFLKWAGGKSQLLGQLKPYFPGELRSGTIRQYVEPFVGGGAMLLYLSRLRQVERQVIADVSHELVLCYRTIQHDVAAVAARLEQMQEHYDGLAPDERQTMFYAIRREFNTRRPATDRGDEDLDAARFSREWIERTAQMIFLNHTCFNGLTRFNSRGEFNVPFGRYTQPKLYDRDNLLAWAAILQRTTILCGDFTICAPFADQHTFVYLDPPYRPLSKTASFTAYSRHAFDDADQRRLAVFFRELDRAGAKVMLSNSNPKNENPADTFFEELYAGYRISTVLAARAINSNGGKRGRISELVIMNY